MQKTVMSPLPGLPHLPDPGGEEGAVLGPEAAGLRVRGLHGAGREEGTGGGGRDDSGTESSDSKVHMMNSLLTIY